MNVTITIGDETKSYKAATKDWVNRLFAQARRVGLLPAVQVHISQPGLVLGLATPGSGSGGGSGSLSPAQRDIVDAWLRHHMVSDKYTGGNLIAFLNDLERLLR